jgi:hypothetical protein
LFVSRCKAVVVGGKPEADWRVCIGTRRFISYKNPIRPGQN